MVELKDVELNNSKDKYKSLKDEYDKSQMNTENLNNTIENLRKALEAAKKEASDFNSQLQSKAATLDSITSQLEIERNRNNELQSKYFSLAESVNRKAE